MKKNSDIEKMTDQEWADAAAWLSGEETSNEESARLLISEDSDIMSRWSDLGRSDNREIDVDKAWLNLSKRIDSEPDVRPAGRTLVPSLFLRIAAMIVILIGLGWIAYEVSTPGKLVMATGMDEKNSEVLLSDGSKVYLNRGSKLTYSEEMGKNSRRVKLEGEAFFEIARDAARPFIIDAGTAKVKVLGTSFNVITDNGNNEVEVYVSTGSVLLSSNDGKRSLTLEPGFIGKLSEESSASMRNTDANYMSWRTDRLSYDGERLEVVFNDLKRCYNIDINTADTSINNYRLTTTFDFSHMPDDTIIKVICTTFNLNSVSENGSYNLYPVRK